MLSDTSEQNNDTPTERRARPRTEPRLGRPARGSPVKPRAYPATPPGYHDDPGSLPGAGGDSRPAGDVRRLRGPGEAELRHLGAAVRAVCAAQERADPLVRRRRLPRR